MSRKFIKCEECLEKPATVRCLHCFNQQSNASKIFCYNCDRIEHQTSEKKQHKKQLIPYNEMIQQGQPGKQLGSSINSAFSNEAGSMQPPTFNERSQENNKYDMPLQSISPTKVEDSVNNFEADEPPHQSPQFSSNKKDEHIYTKIGSIKKKLQENNFPDLLRNS